MDNLHDRVNLIRLVARLEKMVQDQVWDTKSSSHSWISVSNAQQSAKYARQLLKNIQLYEDVSSTDPSTSSFPSIERRLDQIEPVLEETYKRLAPRPKPQKSLLSALPKLERPPAYRSQLPTESPDILPGKQESSASPFATNPAANLFLNPIEEKAISSTPTLLPVFPPKSEALSGEKGKPESSFLETSLQTQEELSRHLAQMATQLRRNAEHFTEALAQDRAVMEGAEEKLEGNLTRIGTERSRLKVHSGKSGSTTWLVLGAIVVVVIAWIMVFLVIRVT